MSIYDTGPCSPWATVDDLNTVGCDSDIDALDMDVWLQAATDMLYPRTGRQWPGECEVTIRPCGTGHGACPISVPVYNDARFEWWWNGWACGGACDEGPGAFRLPGEHPVGEILSVTVDGALLPTGEYRLDNRRILRRLTGGWPRCQNLDAPSSEEGTWAVTYTLGVPPPPAGRLAAAAWACHLAKTATPGDGCVLPAGVESLSRQSVDIVMASASEILDTGRTGVDLVDQFIASTNPQGIAGRARFRSPDDPRYVIPG